MIKLHWTCRSASFKRLQTNLKNPHRPQYTSSFISQAQHLGEAELCKTDKSKSVVFRKLDTARPIITIEKHDNDSDIIDTHLYLKEMKNTRLRLNYFLGVLPTLFFRNCGAERSENYWKEKFTNVVLVARNHSNQQRSAPEPEDTRILLRRKKVIQVGKLKNLFRAERGFAFYAIPV